MLKRTDLYRYHQLSKHYYLYLCDLFPLQVILDKIHPTVRKDCNYSNLERIKQEAVWSDEQSRWRVPDLVVQKTKLPPAGKNVSFVRTATNSPCLLNVRF